MGPINDKNNCDYFFLNAKGKQTRSTDQSYFVRMLLQNAGIVKKHMNCTLIRKRIATLGAATGNENETTMVAELMKHNPSTLKKYYNLLDKNRDNLKAFQFLQKCNTNRDIRLRIFKQPAKSTPNVDDHMTMTPISMTPLSRTLMSRTSMSRTQSARTPMLRTLMIQVICP